MLTFNGKQAGEYGLIVREVTERVLPSINHKALSTNGMNGLRDFGYRLEAKEISVKFGVTYPSLHYGRIMVREISRWLLTEEVAALTFEYEPDKEYMARVTEAGELTGEYLYEEFDVVFTIPTGLAQSIDTETRLLNPGENIVDVLGTYKTYPVYIFNVNTNVSSLQISNNESKLKVVDNFVPGDEVVIDCEKGKVTVNGSIVPIITVTSDYFPLNVGQNTLTVTGGQVEVSYKARWL